MSIYRSLVSGLAAAFFLSGCATVKQIGFPDTTSNKGKKVTASVSHLNILFLVPPSNIDKLVDDLSEQCGGGKVEGITLVDTRRFIFYLAENITLEASGHCAE